MADKPGSRKRGRQGASGLVQSNEPVAEPSMLRKVSPLVIGLLAQVLITSGQVAASAPPSWGNLEPGPYAVGFRSLWQMDYSRVYNTVFNDKTTYASGKAPRPILINLWYPAERPSNQPPMLHRDYLKIQTEDPRLARFTAKLAEYERDTVSTEVMGKPDAALTVDERRRLEHFWAASTACFRDAPPLGRRFPLVIYHAGAGSSFEDNAVFCEFLASHGYIVVGSAFQNGTGRTLAVDGRDGSARDLEFLIAHARRQPNVDWQAIGLVGHSLGAQAILMFRAQAASPVDAVVSLDSTQDYHTLASPGWRDMTRQILENSRHFQGALLMVANSKALFQLADSLDHAERYYFTLKDQDHDEFVSQGILRRALENAAKPGDRGLRNELERGRAGYESVCAYALAFFDVYLKRQSGRREALLHKFRDTKFGGDQPHVEYLPIGATGPELYRDELKVPPTLRQVRLIIAARGIEATMALLKQWRAQEPAAPIFEDDFGFALVDECLGQGRIADAIAINRFYSAHNPKFSKIFVRTGEGYRKAGLLSFAHDYFKKACLLDSDDTVAAARVKELETLMKK
jgi:pimeloyl-ACP methyl ester carboxylesterase